MNKLPIATGFYQSEILQLAAQTCNNWIPIVPKGAAVNDRALLDRPGLTKLGTLTGNHRGAIDFNGVYISLNGTVLSSVDSSGIPTTLGVVPGDGRVSMAKNDDFVSIVINNGDCYNYDGSTVAKVTDGQYVSASTVAFVDGFFVYSQTNGEKFFISALNDPTSFDALDFSTAEQRPDPIVAVFVYNNQLHVLGTETIEKYNNQGGVNFPFIRINGASNTTGCYSKFTPLEVNNNFVFVGGAKNQSAGIYLMSGNNPQRISTPAIDNVLETFTDTELTQAYSMTWEKAGQLIIAITICSTNVTGRTFCFNFTSGEWFEFSSAMQEYRARSVVKIYNKFFVGDNGGQVGYMDDSVHEDYGTVIYREKASQPFLNQEGEEYIIGSLEAWFESGVGKTTGQGSDPVVRMDFSDDLGRTWSNALTRKIGKIGKYGQRSTWRRQGWVSRDRVFRFRASDPVRFNLMKLTAE